MTFFEFTVRHLRWLARIPGLPQLFDAMLLAWTALRHPSRMRAMEQIEAAALGIPGISLGVHRFGGTGFILAGSELAHIHGNGLLDVHTGRSLADEVIADHLAEPHHLFGRSAWISFWVRTVSDADTAIRLLQRAAEERRRTAPQPLSSR